MIPEFWVRKADAADVDAIHRLLEHYAEKGVVLRRSREDIVSRLGNFYVAECAGVFLGCGAVRGFDGGLKEVRSLVVTPDAQGRGIGRALVEKMLADLKSGPAGWRLFTLTTTPAFFQRLGFQQVAINCFPEKIWSDCRNCPKREHCDEVPLIFQGKTAEKSDATAKRTRLPKGDS